VRNAEAIIRGEIRDGLGLLKEHADEHHVDFSEISSGLLNQLTSSINELHLTMGIKKVADGDPRPDHARGE
jgi:hypothetical protein